MKRQNFFLFLTLYMAQIICAQGGGSSGGTPGGSGPGFGTDTIPDTTYYKSAYFGATEKIYSIMQYNTDKSPKRFTVYYVNGQIVYHELFEWLRNELSKETYYDAAGQMTFYGTYTTSAGGGKTFRYYDKSGVLLCDAVYGTLLSALDSTPQCRTYTVRTTAGLVRYLVNYEYTADGWLTKEKYLDHKGDTLGIGVWGWDPVSGVTAYIYKCKNNKRLYNSIGELWYDQYRYYYHDTVKAPDSLKVYNRDTLLYTCRFEYDAQGWMTKDRYLDKTNLPIYHGEYTFDKSTFITTYCYFKEPATLLFETTYNYRDYYTNTGVYETGLLHHNVKYAYNTGGFWDTVRSVSPSGALLNYETYVSYLPYYWTKKYTTFDSKNAVTSYYSYNEFGVVLDSMLFQNTLVDKKAVIPFAGDRIFSMSGNTLRFTLHADAPVGLTVTDLAGNSVAQINRRLPAGTHRITLDRPVTSGIYHLSGSLGSLPVNTKICSLQKGR